MRVTVLQYFHQCIRFLGDAVRLHTTGAIPTREKILYFSTMWLSHSTFVSVYFVFCFSESVVVLCLLLSVSRPLRWQRPEAPSSLFALCLNRCTDEPCNSHDYWTPDVRCLSTRNDTNDPKTTSHSHTSGQLPPLLMKQCICVLVGRLKRATSDSFLCCSKSNYCTHPSGPAHWHKIHRRKRVCVWRGLKCSAFVLWTVCSRKRTRHHLHHNRHVMRI